MICLVLDPKTSPNDLPSDAVVLVRSGVGLEKKIPNSLEVGVLKSHVAADICRQLISIINHIQNKRVRKMALALINDFYAYSILPLIAIVFALSELLEKYPDAPLIVYTSKRSGPWPHWGFKTLEITKGSETLLHSHLASLLNIIFPSRNIFFHYTSRDIFCYEPARRIILNLLNFALTTNLIIKVIWLILRRPFPKKTKVDLAISVRSKHQARFAKYYLDFDNNKKIQGSKKVLILPQLSSMSFNNINSILTDDLYGCEQIRPTFRILIKAFMKARKDKHLARNFQNQENFLIFGDKKIPFNLKEFLQEMSFMSSFFFNSFIWIESLRASKVKRVISFEAVGKVAGLEATRAEEVGILSCNVQTIAISNYPLPVFPLSSQFVADSETSKNQLRHLGEHAQGTVTHLGCPYPTPVKRPCITSYKKLTFFTQPDEVETTLEILGELIKWSKANGAKLTIRLHPRDDANNYQRLIALNAAIVSLSKEKTLLSDIENSDVCITRTSSVAKDVIAAGYPLILCVWSVMNRNFNADYIMNFTDHRYISYDAADLQVLLSKPKQINLAMIKLRENFWPQDHNSSFINKLLQ